MRIWMLAPLLYAVAAIGGDRGMEPSSQFFDRVIATSPRFIPSASFSTPSVRLRASATRSGRRASRVGIRLLSRINRTATSNPGTAAPTGYVNDSYVPPQPLSKEAEIARAQEAFTQGKYMRSASFRGDLSKRERSSLQSVQDQAWQRQQAATR